MGGKSIWVGERRICSVHVRSWKDVKGLGRLPHGLASDVWLFRGGEVHGVRARLFREGVLIAEDLHVGAVRKRLGFLNALGFPSWYTLATGYGDVRKGDVFELYLRPNDGDLVPGYQDLPDRRQERGRAQVDEVVDGPLSSRIARVTPSQGKLAVGDRVRILRNGRPMAEALRLLAMTDLDGHPIDNVSAGHGASLYLGYRDLSPGDTVVAFDVPPPEWTEARADLLDVHILKHADSAVAQAVVLPVPFTPGKGKEPAVGFRARVVRQGVVIADGLTIGYFPDVRTMPNGQRPYIRTGGQNGLPKAGFYIGLDFPELREVDKIEPYVVVPARRAA